MKVASKFGCLQTPKANLKLSSLHGIVNKHPCSLLGDRPMQVLLKGGRDVEQQGMGAGVRIEPV